MVIGGKAWKLGLPGFGLAPSLGISFIYEMVGEIVAALGLAYSGEGH